MSRRTVLLPLFALPALLAILAAPVGAASTPAYPAATGASGVAGPQVTAAPGGKSVAPARISIQLANADHHQLAVGERLHAIGRIKPFVPHQKVAIKVVRKHVVVKKRKFRVTQIGHSGVGRFHLRSKKLIAPGPYQVSAQHLPSANQGYGRRLSRKVRIAYPNLNPGDHSDSVRLFTHLLADRGYYTPRGRSYDEGVGLAVLAFRKVNGMSRTTNATPSIFRTLAKNHGGFRLKYPDEGKHAEVDISRQVLVLADHGKAQYIFHASTGAPATPTITGHYSVYSKVPGTNSHGMYMSSFWHGGYAIHGYPSVPTYNASHGCVRVPNSDAVFIYDWLPVGTPVDTYY